MPTGTDHPTASARRALPPVHPLDAQALPALLREPDGPVLTVLLPLHHGQEQHADHVVLKHLLQEVVRASPAAAPLAAMLTTLTATPTWWATAGAGMALIASATGIHAGALPEAVPALAVVGPRPHLLPFYEQLARPRRFAVLELTQRGVTLLAGDRARLVPTGLVWEHTQGSTSQHDQASEHHLGARHLGDHFHYFGTAPDVRLEPHVKAFFREVDRAVGEHLAGSGLPLVLVGVSWLLPLYREVSRYPHLASVAWAHGTDRLEPAAIHRWCCEQLAPAANAPLRTLSERHLVLQGGPRILTDLERALPAARAGMVASLILAGDRPRWGHFDPIQGTVVEHDQREPGDEELLNTLLTITAAGGSEVHVVPHDQVPGGLVCSAMLRY